MVWPCMALSLWHVRGRGLHQLLPDGQRGEMGLDSPGLPFLLLHGQGGLIWGLSASPTFPVNG